MSSSILILNGPNLNQLGRREVSVYGETTYQNLITLCEKTAHDLGLSIQMQQYNHEGDMIEAIHAAVAETDGLIINAGALTHTSLALHDALRLYPHPIVEVHISNIFAREPVRHHSYVAPLAKGILCGFGIKGYKYALMHLAEILNPHDENAFE
ncbi:MAG: type II 3-dehydroquinate dehydratase [Alphaproteobacteria bacterium]